MKPLTSQEMTLQLAKELEKRDEQQVIAEMRGEIVRSWVYQIQLGNRTVTNLSYAGVKEAIRRRGNLSTYPCSCCQKTVHVEETDSEIRALVRVWDLNNNVEVLGASSAKKGPFDFVLAVNKAERNAWRKLLPEKQIALLIEQWLKGPEGSGEQKPPPGKLA